MAPLAPLYMFQSAVPRHQQRTEEVYRGGEEEWREVRKSGTRPRRAARRRWRRGGAARHNGERHAEWLEARRRCEARRRREAAARVPLHRTRAEKRKT